MERPYADGVSNHHYCYTLEWGMPPCDISNSSYLPRDINFYRLVTSLSQIHSMLQAA